MALPATKVIEHPDLFVQKTDYSIEDFDYIIEIRETEDREITYEQLSKIIYLIIMTLDSFYKGVR